MDTATYAIGDFGHQAIVSSYAPTITNMHGHHRAGLPIQVCYLYGGWREADGTLHVFERKFIGPMTAGLWLMRIEGDEGVKLNPESLRTVRGEAKRSYGPEEIVWHGQMMENPDSRGMELRFTDGNLDWIEGDLLDLHGDLVGPGLQVSAPDTKTPFYYGSELYRVSGVVSGADVEGFVFLDFSAWAHGTDWKEYEMFNHLQLGWQAFANEFEDGSIEWGHLCIGAENYSFTMTSSADGATSLNTVGTVGGFDLDENEWARRGVWKNGDECWTFELENGGRLREFTEARWGGYRAQCGLTAREGETRGLKVGFAWLETFATRLADHGIGTVGEILND